MKVEVTDHALVRYLERVHGVDMDAFREELAALAQPFVDARVSCAPVGAVWLRIEDNRLITVTPSKPRLHVGHDHQDRNGSAASTEPLNWKARERKRGRK
ncbi:hypothetical protein NPA31_011775 [Aurantimonas sp. MSK8Z-1]|uniref:hypothetical protein n=1 Tax=Mangrovibrevibacter kandeliae TaxID=2968473 RepID=UPI0021173965|nr:hypothetical protein [Aurantimonas sp. MSK8Z-1]MCW4115642.1 hypothetical protein [Aurantimonas sp. MSK8Z-1]